MYLTQGLHRSLQANPDGVATVFGNRRRTFGEHGDRIARLAGGLRALGVVEGDRVAILSLNSDRYAEYLLATPWAGAVLTPLNIRWSPTELAHVLDDSGARVLLVDDAFAPMTPTLTGQCPTLAIIVHCGDGPTPDGMYSYEQLLAGSDPIPDARRSGDDLAGLFYTGGTTGFPKGVMLSHANLITSALGTVATGELLSGDASLLHAAPMFHLADLAAWAGQCQKGGTHVIVSFFDPTTVLEELQQHRVTDVLLVPTMVQALIDHPDAAEYDLSWLHRILYGGSVIAEGVLERTQTLLPHVRLTQAYGMTELAPVATLLLPHHHHGAYRRSAGKPAPHAEVRIVDEHGNEAPRGETGEVCVRGGHVMQGYWNQPEETATVLRDGWMHTGDAGYLDHDGFLFVVDRIKDMIITGGENVYSAEVESVLSTHPAVLTSAVIGLPDAEWGERVHACVVVAKQAQTTEDELRDFCRQHIAGYKTPRSIDFHTELPTSGAGKTLKRELRAYYA